MELIGQIAELGVIAGKLRGELEAVKSGRDFLRTLLSAKVNVNKDKE